MKDFALIVGVVVLGVGSVLLLSTIMAFPLKWCWNYSVAPTFSLPEIGFGKAWCLMFAASVLIKPSLTCKHDCKKS